MKWLALGSCVVAAALPLCTAAAAPAHSRLADSVVTINFAVVPGQPLMTGQRPQFSFSLQATAGQPMHQIVAVVNGSKTAPLTATLAVGDAVTPAQGAGLSFIDTGAQHQIGRWTQLGSYTVTVPPYQITYVPITITVPAGARPGDYEGSIRATTITGAEFTQGRIHTYIHTSKRCLIYLRVAGRVSAGLRIARAGMTRLRKHAILDIALNNTGTLIAAPATAVMTFTSLYKTYTLRAPIGMVLGGASTTVAFDVSRALPKGAYKARIAVTYGVRPIFDGPYQTRQASWTGNVVVT